MFFRIQRHSDHHSHVYRPYQVLRKFGLAPQLPYCYVGTLLVEFCPPLWKYLMDPRIKAIHDTQKGIPNDDQWNEGQPMSAADKERDAVVQIYFTIILIVFTAAVFGQGFVLAK